LASGPIGELEGEHGSGLRNGRSINGPYNGSATGTTRRPGSLFARREGSLRDGWGKWDAAGGYGRVARRLNTRITTAKTNGRERTK
jgi:hypothetical protein